MYADLLLTKQFTIHSQNVGGSAQCSAVLLKLTDRTATATLPVSAVRLTLEDWLPVLEASPLACLVFQLIRHIPDKMKTTGLILMGQKPT